MISWHNCCGVFIVRAAQLVSLWLWGVSPCAARQTSARTKESSQSQQGKPVAGQAGVWGWLSPKHQLLGKVCSTAGSPHPANVPAQGVHRAAKGGTCALLDQSHVQPHLCTLHQHSHQLLPSQMNVPSSFQGQAACWLPGLGALGTSKADMYSESHPQKTQKKAIPLNSAGM